MNACACDVKFENLRAADNPQRIGFDIKILKCPLCEAAPELLRLLDLIAAEFKRDPTSVECFDLAAIARPAIALVAKLKAPPLAIEPWADPTPFKPRKKKGR